MSCFRPNICYADSFNDDGTLHYTFVPYNKYHSKGLSVSDYEQFSIPTTATYIGCKKCQGCRLDRARQWADRMTLELDWCKGKALFLTLTYDNEHLPKVNYDGQILPTLFTDDVQKFNKRLRKYFSDRMIRYFTSGEYGSLRGRPHYHGIYFNLGFDDFPDLKIVRYSKLGFPIYQSDILKRIWKNGFVSINEVNYNTMGYVARYTLKKSGELFYKGRGVKPPFSVMSLKPGIGFKYLEDHKLDVDFCSVPLYDGKEVRDIPLTLKMIDRLDVDPVQKALIRKQKQELSSDIVLSKLSLTDLDYLEYLVEEEKSLKSKTNILKNRSDF